MRIALTAGIVLAGSISTAASHAGPALAYEPHRFAINDMRGNSLSEISLGPDVPADMFGLGVLRAPDGTVAAVDRSLMDVGLTAAVGTRFVDLSWDGFMATTPYGISRDGELVAELPAGVTNYRDTTIADDRAYRYNIVPLDQEEEPSAARMWSVEVHTPRMTKGQITIVDAMKDLVVRQAQEIASAATTTITWESFIPQKFVDAPPVGCDYKSGFKFGGDNRSFDWTSSSYRTAVNAVIDWGSKNVDGHVSIGKTTVYRKSDGKLVASKTASGGKSYAKKMSSGKDYVGVRLVTHAGNPYCGVGAIDGGLSMHMTQKRNYSVVSGNHRQMPNHHVYIFHGGKVTDVYRKVAAGPECLLGSAVCRLANFFGRGAF